MPADNLRQQPLGFLLCRQYISPYRGEAGLCAQTGDGAELPAAGDGGIFERVGLLLDFTPRQAPEINESMFRE